MLEEHGFFDLTEMIQPAVYALVYRGVVVYIGKSMMPVSRIYFHRNQRHKYVKGHRISLGVIAFDELWLRPCSLSTLDRTEDEMIKTFQPKHNKTLKNGNSKKIVEYEKIDFNDILSKIVAIEPRTHPCMTGKINRRI